MKQFLHNLVHGTGMYAGRLFGDNGATDQTEAPGTDAVVEPADLSQWALSAAAQWPAFAAVILQVDIPVPSKLFSDINTALDRLQQDNGDRFWRQVTGRCWICFHALSEGRAALQVATQTYRMLADCQAQAIIAGAATFPFLDQRVEQVTENAAKALYHASFFGPGSVVVLDDVTLNVSGDFYYHQGHTDAALHDYQQGLKMNPKAPNLLNSLGVCYGDLGQYQQALDCFQHVLAQAPQDYLALYNIGMVHFLEQRYEAALEHLTQAAQIAPDSLEVAFQTNQVYMRLNKPEDALACMQNAHRLRPESALLWGSMGECLAMLNKLPSAIIAYRQAIKFNPRDHASLSALGHLYDIQNENTDIAIVFCEQSVAMASDNGLYHHRLAGLYQKAGRFQDALTALETAASLGHEDAERIAEIKNQLGAVSAKHN